MELKIGKKKEEKAIAETGLKPGEFPKWRGCFVRS
jgi:hypothetical protein